jgi:hypothetical protein
MSLSSNQKLNNQAFINPEQLWGIEDILIDIPLQYREEFWNELLLGFVKEYTIQEN